MNPGNSPFAPNRLAPAETFIGRERPIAKLLAMVRKARRGKLQVGWIAGEHGVGKSSLAALVGLLAERNEKAVRAHVRLGSAQRIQELPAEALSQLLKDNENKSWGRSLWRAFDNGRIENSGPYGAGIRLRLADKEQAAALRDFADIMAQLVNRAGSGKSDRKVLLLILDDIEDLAADPEFADWLMRLAGDAANGAARFPVCLLFVCTETCLYDAMESATANNVPGKRAKKQALLPTVRLQPWTLSESAAFFRTVLKRRNVVLSNNGIKPIARYCGGLPLLAHEIGDAVWRQAKNKKVTPEEMFHGIVEAGDAVKRRFLKSELVRELQSRRYRSILKKLTAHDDIVGVEFSRKELQEVETLSVAERKGLDNFLNRMRKLGAVVPSRERGRGFYRFASHLYKAYFQIETMRARNR